MSNKRIKSVGEMLIIKTREVLNIVYKSILKSLSNNYFKLSKSLIIKLFDSNYFRKYLVSFFSLNPLSQLIDEKNIYSEISHKRRIYCHKTQSLTLLNIREIHPSQIGRICPIETVEGKRAGLVLNFSTECDLSEKGFLRSVFFL